MTEYKITEQEAFYAQSGSFQPARVTVQIICGGRHFAFKDFATRAAADAFVAERVA